MDKYLVVDCEADDLLYGVSKIHCVVMYSSATEQFSHYWDRTSTPITGVVWDGGIETALKRIRLCVENRFTIVGHNLSGYDIPMWQKLHPHLNAHSIPLAQLQDTYINTCLLHPEEPYSLAYWGDRLGIMKPIHEDWSVLSEDMLLRCHADVKINNELYLRQCKEGIRGLFWTEARNLEACVNTIHAKQTVKGMRVNVLRAASLIKELDTRREVLTAELHKRLPATVHQVGVTVTSPFKKDGSLTKRVRDWFWDGGMDCGTVRGPRASLLSYATKPIRFAKIGGPFSKILIEPVDLNSIMKVKEILLSLGWKPTEYNQKRLPDGSWKTMSPKLTEDSYASLPKGVGQSIAEYLMIQHRRRFILNDTDPTKGLLSFVRDDGRVPCDALTCGTNTGRYRHMGAFVNLPKVSTIYGKELRSLFCVPDGCTLLGMDLSGIEARVMAHYAYFYDKGAYRDKVLSKEGVHDANAKALGCDRETAKTFLYAISYGAGIGKLASILGCSNSRAKKLIGKFWDENAGLRFVIEALESEFDEKGFITGLDGRRLFVRHRHKLLNTLVQSAAAIIFKYWMTLCDKYTEDYRGVNQILAYHDELGWEIEGDEPYAFAIGTELNKLLGPVRNHFGLNIPLASDIKTGSSYDQVH